LPSDTVDCSPIDWASYAGLSTTGLELFTLGIVVCSLGTYAAYWRRPQDIHLPITSPVGTGKSLHDVFGEPISPRVKVAWGDIDRDSRELSFSLYLTAGTTGIFGACHLIGWDFLYRSFFAAGSVVTSEL